MDKRTAIRLCKKKYRYFIDHDDFSLLRMTDATLKTQIRDCSHACPLCEYVNTKAKAMESAYLQINHCGSVSCKKYCPLYTQFGKSCGQMDYSNYPVNFANEYVFKLTGDR